MHRPLFLKWAYFGKSGEYEKKNMSIKIVSIFLMLEKPPQFNLARKFLLLLNQISLLVFNPFAPKNFATRKTFKITRAIFWN